MLKACNEYYKLNLNEETKKMFAVMGIGMQTELSCCGAFTVAVGIIGLFTSMDNKLDVDNIYAYEMINELTKFMIENYETLHVYFGNSLPGISAIVGHCQKGVSQ